MHAMPVTRVEVVGSAYETRSRHTTGTGPAAVQWNYKGVSEAEPIEAHDLSKGSHSPLIFLSSTLLLASCLKIPTHREDGHRSPQALASYCLPALTVSHVGNYVWRRRGDFCMTLATILVHDFHNARVEESARTSATTTLGTREKAPTTLVFLPKPTRIIQCEGIQRADVYGRLDIRVFVLVTCNLFAQARYEHAVCNSNSNQGGCCDFQVLI